MAHIIANSPLILRNGESLDGMKEFPEPVSVQPKLDGWRVLFIIKNGKCRALNKDGKLATDNYVKNMLEHLEIVSDLRAESATTYIDAELLGIRHKMHDGRKKLFFHTLETDGSLFTKKKLMEIGFGEIPTYKACDVATFASCFACSGDWPTEGVVRKTEGWAYIPNGKPRSKWFKHKPSSLWGTTDPVGSFEKWKESL